MTTNELIDKVRQWFAENHLNHAVVGYSGGIDSATTAALLSHAGIRVTLVLAEVNEDQKRASNYDVNKFAMHYENMLSLTMCFGMPYYPDYMDSYDANNIEKEAMLPIIRNACFYGVAAQLRSKGDRSVVVGTANFDEAAYLGFWGKASDGAQDFYPISHLHKSEVYSLAKELNVPEEIINATPSGDLQWSGDLNDYKMIGATYDQIEFIVRSIYQYSSVKKVKCSDTLVMNMIQDKVDNPKLFSNNIVRNSHKYKQPFPGVHLSDKLEHFREHAYFKILTAAKLIKEKLDYSIEFSCS